MNGRKRIGFGLQRSGILAQKGLGNGEVEGVAVSELFAHQKERRFDGISFLRFYPNVGLEGAVLQAEGQ